MRFVGLTVAAVLVSFLGCGRDAIDGDGGSQVVSIDQDSSMVDGSILDVRFPPSAPTGEYTGGILHEPKDGGLVGFGPVTFFAF